VVAFLARLRREVSGRRVILWDGASIHRSQLIKEFLATGAAPRLHLERLPAYAPELNSGEGLWAQLKGVERRHLFMTALFERLTANGRLQLTTDGFSPYVEAIEQTFGADVDHAQLVKIDADRCWA